MDSNGAAPLPPEEEDSNDAVSLPSEMWDAVMGFLPLHLVYVDFVCLEWRAMRIIHAKKKKKRPRSSAYQEHLLEQPTTDLLLWSVLNGMRCGSGFLGAIVRADRLEMLDAIVGLRPKAIEKLRARDLAYVAKQGRLATLKRLHELGVEPDNEVARCAAVAGHHHILRWMYLDLEPSSRKKQPVSGNVATKADPEVFDALFRRGLLAGNANTIDRATRMGHAECLAAFPNIHPSARAICDAARSGHGQVFALPGFAVWDWFMRETLLAAFSGGSDAVIQAVARRSQLAPSKIAVFAAMEGRWDFVHRYADGASVGRGDARGLACHAANDGRLEELKWACGLMERKMTTRLRRDLTRNARTTEVALWILSQEVEDDSVQSGYYY
ncbi:hypothetical protein [Medusavirus stheno T3]|uniref:Ankyrin repeat protein n=1 Tax=Medusavirus stheno T3 TaxID=3069717 RepID=A0A7S7YG20_9VIRU|nr:hypothetical protein QKU73_gp318 [Acanthamoeba castellanii medusavirus]QPB44457.1 hypothetical protein [Medusavirus stheno T3]